MQNSINEIHLLFIFTLCGLIIGILFDIFRILRKSFKTPDFVTYIEDILFCIITGIFLIYIILKFSLGELRLYMFTSLIIGIAIYISTISKYFININVKIINIIKVITNKVTSTIILPLKLIIRFIKKVIFKPITFITINIMNIFKKKEKNSVKKKDFPV